MAGSDQPILAEWGRLDICVNCAGIAFAKPIYELDLADWRRVLTVNLDGVFLGTKAAMAAMQATGGCILNVASAAGIKPLAGNAKGNGVGFSSTVDATEAVAVAAISG